MKENLRKQWNDACLQMGIESISAQKAAKIMAVLMELGNNEHMVLNTHFKADCEYIQKRFRINGGEKPDPIFVAYFKEYVTDLKEAEKQGICPQWAAKLFKEDYDMPLYGSWQR